MKSILAHDPAPGFMREVVDEPRRQQSHQPGEADYLTETEEEAYERLLEEDRLRMKAEDEKRMAALWGDQG